MFTFYLVHKSILHCSYVDVLVHVCISVYAGLPGRPVTYDWWDISCYKIKFIYLSIYLPIYLPIYLFLTLTRGTTKPTFGLLLSLIALRWGVSGLWGLFSGSCTESSSLDSYWGCTAAIIPSTKKATLATYSLLTHLVYFIALSRSNMYGAFFGGHRSITF